jgi:hypothetical protein
MKQILLVFFYSKGLVYMHIVLIDASITTICIIKIIGNFMRQLNIKRTEMVSWERFSTGSAYTATIIQDWLTPAVYSCPPICPIRRTWIWRTFSCFGV